MDDAIAHGAMRRLSIDIANLTSTVALQQATAEYIFEIAGVIRPDTWAVTDTGVSALQPDQADAVVALLAALNSLG